MISRKELLTSSEYWIETIQNNIYSELAGFIEKNDISGRELAETLGLSKGRISQILSGKNLNFRLDTLVRLSLAIGRIPGFRLLEIEEYIKLDHSGSDEVDTYRKGKPGETTSSSGPLKRARKSAKTL